MAPETCRCLGALSMARARWSPGVPLILRPSATEGSCSIGATDPVAGATVLALVHPMAVSAPHRPRPSPHP